MTIATTIRTAATAASYMAGRSKGKTCSPEAIIITSDQTRKLRYRDGDTDDIIETILWMDQHSRRWVRQAAAAECLRGTSTEQTLRNVWAFVKHNTRYRRDPEGHEQVQSPGALFASRKGDCKSYSVATAALLRALDIPYRYRFASYEPGGGDYTHVYVMARTPSGWVPVDAVYGEPLREERYTRKTDLTPRAAIGAIDTPDDAAKPDWTKIGLLALMLYLYTSS